MDDSPRPEQPSRADRGARFWRVRLTNWQIILLALVVVGGRLVFDFSNRIIEGQEKITEELQLRAEIERLRAEQRELEAQKAYYSSPAFVEAWAHSEGKMVRDGEVIVVPLYERPTPSPPVASGRQPKPSDPVSPWRIWWSLFFDGSPPLARAR